MQKKKFRVLLYLKKSSLDKSGQAPIMGRITYERTQAQFSCKMSCTPSLWNARESRLSGKSHEATTTNRKIESLLLAIHSAYQRLEARGIPFTAEDIKAQFQGSMQGRTTFLERLDKLVVSMREGVGSTNSKSTYQNYAGMQKVLRKFIQTKFQVSDLAFEQMGEDFMEALEHYSRVDRGHSQGYFRKMAIITKKVCRLAYQEGATDKLLFEHLKFERGEDRLPRALDREGFDRLRMLTFGDYEGSLRRSRDLFLFSCYTGVAFVDLFALSKEHLYRDDSGVAWLKFKRQKTKTLCRVRLFPEAEAILEAEMSEERTSLFAQISYEAYTTHLKALQLRAGLAQSLTSHVGRHTFATLITLERGVPIETVSRMLGHNDIQTTERYASVTPRRLFEEFERFLDFTKDMRLCLNHHPNANTENYAKHI